MTSRSRAVSDTRLNFKVLVDSTDVSTRERKSHLAEVIRNARQRILELLKTRLGNPDTDNWSRSQGRIHEVLKRLDDEVLKREVTDLFDILLDAEEELVEGNLRLVLMVVRRYTTGSSGALEEMDFVQEGCLGLLDAVRRFDFYSSRGYVSYALIRIRKRVLLALEKQHRLVRIPAHIIRKGRYLKEVIDRFAAVEGRYPAPHEIEMETGGNMDWSILLSLTETVDSLQSSHGEAGITLEERLPSSAIDPSSVPLSELVENALKKLDKRAKFVLVMRYGLLDGDTHKLAEIAEILGLSIERTRQIEKASVKALRDDFRGFDISEWLQ